jgi:hypothetical protein
MKNNEEEKKQRKKQQKNKVKLHSASIKRIDTPKQTPQTPERW